MKQTQNDAVLEMLRIHRQGFTPMDALRLLGVSRLAARVNDLRNDGHWIDTTMVEVQTRTGKSRVAMYRLLNQIGDSI